MARRKYSSALISFRTFSRKGVVDESVFVIWIGTQDENRRELGALRVLVEKLCKEPGFRG